MENQALEKLHRGQIQFGDSNYNPIKVSISQFYGIEINDFAVTVAKTALWIAESQMMKKTEEILHLNLDFLPLKSYTNIIEANALRIDWNEVVPKEELNYIMGNPPFVGARLMNKEQKGDMFNVFGNVKGLGNLDYVSTWYMKAAQYMRYTNIESAFVSTNSICQGEQASILWKPILENGININFAYRTFRWDSEASLKAHVHCIIVGFSYIKRNNKRIYDNNKSLKVANINCFLIDAPNIYIYSKNKPICNVNSMDFGSMPNDGGYLSNYSKDDYEHIILKQPNLKKIFKKIYGAEEFINNKERYCIWLKDVEPNVYKNISFIMEAIKNVKELRENSKREATQKLAEIPYLFGEIRQPQSDYLLVPSTSSERRRYIPIGFIDKDIISSNANLVISNADLYSFGILTSNVHMAWTRTVCGRLEMRYRYSAKIVYNNFPWPTPNEKRKAKIEQTAQAILDAREKYPNSSLADLYDELTMPVELRKAHQQNDIAVMEAYGFDWHKMTESDCVAELMKMYQKLTSK